MNAHLEELICFGCSQFAGNWGIDGRWCTNTELHCLLLSKRDLQARASDNSPGSCLEVRDQGPVNSQRLCIK